MKIAARRSRFDRQPNALKVNWVPALTVMVASMTPVVPLIVVAPLSPPWGLLVFLAWRLIRRDVWHPWAGAALGFYDDMWSGQPFGSAMLLWSVALLALDFIDRRSLWRDYWQDWVLGAGASALALTAALWIANQTGGHTAYTYIVPQISFTVLVFPLVMRVCALVDHWRLS